MLVKSNDFTLFGSFGNWQTDRHRDWFLSGLFIIHQKALTFMKYTLTKTDIYIKVCHHEDTGSNSHIIVPWRSGIKYNRGQWIWQWYVASFWGPLESSQSPSSCSIFFPMLSGFCGVVKLICRLILTQFVAVFIGQGNV